MKKHAKPAIQLCPTCGQMRIHHSPRGLYDCKVTPEIIAALRKFKAENGRSWKRELCKLWESGKNTDCELQQAMYYIGPARLYKINLD